MKLIISKKAINVITLISFGFIFFQIIDLVTTMQGNIAYCEKTSFCDDCSFNPLTEKCTCCGKPFISPTIQLSTINNTFSDLLLRLNSSFMNITLNNTNAYK